MLQSTCHFWRPVYSNHRLPGSGGRARIYNGPHETPRNAPSGSFLFLSLSSIPSAMTDQPRSKIIKDNPIGKGFDAFHASFNLICKDRRISRTSDALEQLAPQGGDMTGFTKAPSSNQLIDLQNLALDLLLALQTLPASRLLRSKTCRKPIFSDLSSLSSAIISGDFDLDRIKPLLNTALNDPDDTRIWAQVSDAVTESTPPPRPVAPSHQQTPWGHSSFANSSEYRQDVDPILKLELGPLYVGVRRLRETYFGGVAGLATASETVFQKCVGGSNPLFSNKGWSEWPADTKEKDVLAWFGDLIPKLEAFAGDYNPTSISRRKLLAQPKTPLLGSTGKRSMDIGFVNDNFTHDPKAEEDFRYRRSHVLVPGELKSNPSADVPSIARIDLATYAREVLSAQDTRRFVLGFTLCGSLMRIWAFDRLGGIASEQFDINKDGLQFVSTVLGFLWMNEEELGFDPTFMIANGQRFIEIKRNSSLTERFIIDEVIRRTRCIAGRATTCWKAHREGDLQKLFVIKDSWQYPERDEEGDMLREATGKDVVHVARYYHHETVQVGGMDDDVQSNIRKGLDITRATNYRPGRSGLTPSISASMASSRSNSTTAGVKRSSSQAGASLPPSSKRSCSVSSRKASSDALLNRVHRRIILRDYGRPIYKASSRSALLTALEGCIEGHESLHKAGFLHRDISINNLMINEDDNNSWSSFLIDLDLAIKEQRDGTSGAHGKTGTRAFMAIGALLGEQHSFMHDLESFFWVLFWICIHYNGSGKDIGPTEFESWNYENDDRLADLKKGQVSDEGDFIRRIEKIFTSHYRPLIPWVNRLRKKVFPNGARWKRLEPELYSSMKKILHDARKDPEVLADG